MLIDRHSHITMHFSLALEDGSVIDSNFAAAPVSFTHGDGNLLPGFEDQLLGLAAGDKATFRITAEQGFGQHNPSNVQQLKRKLFPADMKLVQGLVVSFMDAARGELPGVIATIEEDEIAVDFNHPLAGKLIVFDVHILDVRNTEKRASPELNAVKGPA